jgi:tRNA modification GTPase
MSDRDTIFAPSTPPGRGGIAVVRISGPDAGAALHALGGPATPVPRRATRVRLAAPEDGGPIDEAIALWFPAPRSFTGEDQVELHLHGGPAVVAAALEALGRLPRLRLAEPGEFTRRAFDNGKLDLSEAEGLADLIAAETEAQRRQALRQMGGALSVLSETWRARLVRALAHLEADLDFPDEDLPGGLAEAARYDISGLLSELTQHLEDRRGERLRDGFWIVILGPPNVGKSSLLNAIARRDAAIVSETAGTTRDLIEVHLDLAGYPVSVTDTAGLRRAADAGADPVEAEGIRRALARAEAADLRLVVSDIRDWPSLEEGAAALVDDSAILVLNKVDLASAPAEDSYRGRPLYAVSAREGSGLTELLAAVEREVVASLGVSGAAPALTRQRHRAAVEDCHAGLVRALDAASPELAAEDLRLAARALGRIAGRVDVEDVLDVIFREFCIGK